MDCCKSPIVDAKFLELEDYVKKILLKRSDSKASHGRSKLIQVLHYAQHLFGYLPDVVQERVAELLTISPADVYGVVSFYSYFSMVPKGKYCISVCTGTACYVKGAEDILHVLEDELSLKAGETTKDMKFSIDILRCIGACGIAPVVLVNDKTYGNVTQDSVRTLIKKYSSDGDL